MEYCYLNPQITNTVEEASNNGEPTERFPIWRALSSELLSGDGFSIDFQPFRRIEAQDIIQCIAFARGDIAYCRLPHRTVKRRSSVVQQPFVSLILLGLMTGHTEVYNLEDLKAPVSRVPNLVLYADSLPIYHLVAATDYSLRVASVSENGEVKLWDLWDDGNMYASLKPNFVFPCSKESGTDMIQGEACTFAWQPHGHHVCLAGKHGYGVILVAEKPFNRVATLRSGHYNRVSSASYTSDASLLVTAAYDSSCIVWSVPEYAPLHHYWHMGRVPSLLLLGGANGHHLYDLCISPDDLHFATVCEDRCVRIWPLVPTTSPVKTYYELALTQVTGLKLRSIACSPCGRLIAVTTSDGRVLAFTTSSLVITLTTQCLRVLRRCITRHLMQQYPTQVAISNVNHNVPDVFASRALCIAASDLPLPPQLMLTVFREFGTLSQPYFQNRPPLSVE